MAVVTAQHHSAQRCCTIATQTDDSPALSYAATAASPMVECMDPAPVSTATLVSLTLRPLCAARVFASRCRVVVVLLLVVQASPHVVVSLPPVAEFTWPMYNPVHQEQFAAVPVDGHFSPVPGVVTRRPSPLVEVRPSVRAQRHIVEDLGELAPLVQILDLPVPQTVDSVGPDSGQS